VLGERRGSVPTKNGFESVRLLMAAYLKNTHTAMTLFGVVSSKQQQ
jgi:hypothetical protein